MGKERRYVRFADKVAERRGPDQPDGLYHLPSANNKTVDHMSQEPFYMILKHAYFGNKGNVLIDGGFQMGLVWPVNVSALVETFSPRSSRTVDPLILVVSRNPGTLDLR